MLSWLEIDARAAAFAARWRDCSGDERQFGQTFEKDFMQVFGVEPLEGLHEYQVRLRDGSIAYVDYLLPGRILIEIKSRGKSLATAYAQAMSYVRALKPEEVPALVMVCDFDQVQVYNLKKDHPYKPFRVRQLKGHTRIFSQLAGYGAQAEEATEIEVKTAASYKMARIHDALKENGYSGHALEVFLVRLLFCLFADDTGIFEKDSFQHNILASRVDGSDLSGRLSELFWVLNTPESGRMKTMPDELKRFRYINGSIFRDPLPPASFDGNMRDALVEVSREFDWTLISPSIFGAMFQGVMDQQARRALGAHYTSQENILKVIRPLFLDALYDEFERCKSTTRELRAFQDKLASLHFLDLAAGTGTLLMALGLQFGKDKCTIFAQDRSQKSNKMLKLNLILNSFVSSLDHAIQGDTLTDPYHISDDGSSLRQFDYLVCNPPFKLDFSETREQIAAIPGRFWAGVSNVPAMKKSMAIYTYFIQHLLNSLRDTGKYAIVLRQVSLLRKAV